MSDELKLCPFCSGDPQLLNGGPGNWYVRCAECKVSTNDVQQDHAIELWNARPRVAQSTGGQITDEMIERAIDAHVELFDSGDAVGAMRAALQAALAPGNGAVEAVPNALNVVRQMVEAYDAGQLRMESPEIGDPDSGIPLHPWHEEMLHYARNALGSVTSTKRASLRTAKVEKSCGHPDCEFPKCDCEEEATNQRN